MLILKPIFVGRASEGPVKASDRAGKAKKGTGAPLRELEGAQRAKGAAEGTVRTSQGDGRT